MQVKPRLRRVRATARARTDGPAGLQRSVVHDALVVIVHLHREHLLGQVLPDHHLRQRRVQLFTQQHVSTALIAVASSRLVSSRLLQIANVTVMPLMTYVYVYEHELEY